MIACFLMPQIAIATERSRMPGLWGEPLAVCSEDDILLVVSAEAASYGVQVGHKSTGARSLCPSLRILPYERDIYEQTAALIWDSIAVETSIVEPVSPEFCYAEIDDRHTAPRLTEFTRDLSDASKMDIFVGLATSKIVAKFAAKHAAPYDPVVVFPGSEGHMLAEVTIDSLCVVDSAILRRLTKLGVLTLGNLQTIAFKDLQKIAGKQALPLSRLACGLDGDPVRRGWPRPIITMRYAFDYDVTLVEPIYDVLLRLSKRLSRALHQRREFASYLTVTLSREDMSIEQQSEKMPGPVQTAAGIYAGAERLMNRLGSVLTKPVVAISVTAAQLSIASGNQLELLDVHGNHLPAETIAKMNAALETVRRRFGVGAVLKAATIHKARRIDCWTSPLCRQVNDITEVEAAPDGTPLQFWRGQQLWCVAEIEHSWREALWVSNEVIEERIYRVATDPPGLFELRRIGKGWRVTAAAD